MKEITGPIPCALCGLQIWNDEMARAVDDGDPQYVCLSCIKQMIANDSVLVKTKGGE